MGFISVFRDAVRTVTGNWWTIIGLAPPLLLPAAIYFYLPIPTFEDGLHFINYGPEIGSVLDMMLPILLASPLQAALLHSTFQANTGQVPPFLQSLAQGLTHGLPIFTINLLILTATAVGSAFLILPGIFVLVCLSLAPAVYIAEREDVIGSLQRSWALSRGHRWKLLRLIAIFFLVGKAADRADEIAGLIILTARLIAEPIFFGNAYLQIRSQAEDKWVEKAGPEKD